MDFDRQPRGIELTQEQFERGVTVTRHRADAKYAWSAGEAMSRFLEELKAGKLIARDCRGCERILFPPRMFCELCYRPTDTWRYIRDTGKIETFSISYLDQDARRIREPIFVGVVSLDGATEKMGIMHYFDEIPSDSAGPLGKGIRIGMRVKAVWKALEDREGSVLDIKHFRPLKPEEDTNGGGA